MGMWGQRWSAKIKGLITGVIGMKFSAEKILAEAKRLEPVLREIRRDFHRHPELGFHEFRTTEKIREILSSIPGMRLLPLAMKTGAAAELPVISLKTPAKTKPASRKSASRTAKSASRSAVKFRPAPARKLPVKLSTSLPTAPTAPVRPVKPAKPVKSAKKSKPARAGSSPVKKGK